MNLSSFKMLYKTLKRKYQFKISTMRLCSVASATDHPEIRFFRNLFPSLNKII